MGGEIDLDGAAAAGSGPTLTLPETPLTWVFAGDSITQGIVHTHGQRGWVEILAEHIRWSMGRLDDVVINTGMSGWTAPMVLERFDHLIGRFNPGVVSLSLGTNDAYCEYDDLGACEASLRELVERSRALGAHVVMHGLLDGVAGFEKRRPRWDDFVACVSEVAASEGVLFVDHTTHWRERFAEWEPIAWMDDDIHPNAVGHRHLAMLTAKTLGLGDVSYQWATP